MMGGPQGLPESLVDNRDPVSDSNSSDYSSRSRSTSRSGSRSGSEERSGYEGEAKGEMYSDVSDGEVLSADDNNPSPVMESQKHKRGSNKGKYDTKMRMDEFSNIERLKAELAAKKIAQYQQIIESNRPPASKVSDMGSDTEFVPVKRVTTIEKGKKVTKITKVKKKKKKKPTELPYGGEDYDYDQPGTSKRSSRKSRKRFVLNITVYKF